MGGFARRHLWKIHPRSLARSMVTTTVNPLEPTADDPWMAPPFGSESFRRIRRSPTGLALFDQAILSGTSLIMIVAVKRFAGLEALGLYSLAYSVLMVALCFQRSLTISPYTIFCRRVDELRRAGMRASARLQVTAFALIGAIISLLGWLIARQYVGEAYLAIFAVMILALPAELFKDYFRSMSIADGNFRGAIKIDGLTSFLQLSFVAVLGYVGRLDGVSAILALACARVLVAASFFVVTISQHRWASINFLSDIEQSWSIGSWLMLSQVTHATQSYALHWVVAITLGVSQSGIFSACWTVVQLISPFVQGLGNAFEPQIAHEYVKNGIAGVNRFVTKASTLVGLIAFIYWSVLAVFGSSILALLYGDDARSDAMLTLTLASAAAILAIGMVAGKGLAVLERPNLSFFSTLTGLVLSLLITIVLIVPLGTFGAAIGAVVGALSTTGIRWLLYRKVSRQKAVRANESNQKASPSGDQNQ